MVASVAIHCRVGFPGPQCDRLHARALDDAFEHRVGQRTDAIGACEDAPEPGRARRAWAIDPFQGLADPPLARPSPKRVVERLLDPIVATHRRTEVAQRASDVRARDVVDPRVIATLQTVT